MGSADRFPQLVQSLEKGDTSSDISESPLLTPRLCVVVAILYMMAVDSDISEYESSQLQAVVGTDADTLKRAIAYSEKNSVAQFLKDAPPLLDARVRLCLLVNVCDSLMADGVMVPGEEQLFDRMLSAMGHTKVSFQPYFDTITIKDKTSIFGDFDVATKTATLTPPLALVASLIYMMAADGSMAEEEVGRLNAVVGCSPDLLKTGLRYVSKVRAPQFLALAAPMLNERQRLCILLNACDTMMSDHKVMKVEKDLFRRMLTSFEVSEKEFERYLNIIFLKNDLPEETIRPFVSAKKSDVPPPRRNSQEEGVVFQRKKEWDEETGEAGQGDAQARQSASSARQRSEQPSEMESRISTTMRQNTDRLAQELAGDTALESLEKNSRAQDPAGSNVSKAEGKSDTRTVRDTDTDINSNKALSKNGGPADQRAVRDANADNNSKKSLDKKDGVADTRALRDAEADNSSNKANGKSGGPADQRAVRDAEADNGSNKAKGKSDGPADQRAVSDGDADNGSNKAKGKSEGPADQRAVRDGDADSSSNKVKGKNEGPADQRAARDADADIESDKTKGRSNGPADQRAVRDADADNSSNKAKGKSEGPADQRAARDADIDSDKTKGKSDRPADPRALRDKEGASRAATAVAGADGPGEIRALKDTAGGTGGSLLPGISAGLSQRLRDAKKPAERRELTDADGVPANRRMSDARHAFDPTANESNDGPIQIGDIDQRMEATRDRTFKIFGYVEAIRSSKSITSASRLPLLPILPFTHKPVPALIVGNTATLAAPKPWDDGSRTLLASDQGGPIMSESQGKAPATSEEANLNKKLRYSSAVLLPALFLSYGITMVGESVTQHGFVVNENIATDARIVHQMASVQQTVYRIAPESVILSVDKLQQGVVQAVGAVGSAGTMAVASTGAPASGSTSGGDDKELSDRAKADNFLEQRKQELMAVAKNHQGASAVAAERQQWFIYAKSIVLLGLGMAFWGVLFRSMRMLHVSTAIGVLSLLLTANGYWLFVQL
jgi:uncharacterized tellurite resistance protein B-like protein